MEQGFEEILITGGTGWLGQNFLRFLNNNKDRFYESVEKIRIFVHDKQNTGVEVNMGQAFSTYEGDLRNTRDVETFLQDLKRALFIHTAGVIHPWRTKYYDAINHKVTANLLERAAATNIRRFLVVSSSACVGYNSQREDLFNEAAEYAPQGEYGRSKMLMELEAKKYWEDKNLSTTIIRPPWFYGPMGPPRQKHFFKLVREGRMPVIGSGKNRRSMVFLPKLCEAIALASTRKVARDSLYWIADNNPYEFRGIIETIQTVFREELDLSCAKSIRKLPSFICTFSTVLSSFTESLGVHFKSLNVLSELNKNIACDVSKARSELGFMPKESLRPGITKTLWDEFSCS